MRVSTAFLLSASLAASRPDAKTLTQTAVRLAVVAASLVVAMAGLAFGAGLQSGGATEAGLVATRAYPAFPQWRVVLGRRQAFRAELVGTVVHAIQADWTVTGTPRKERRPVARGHDGSLETTYETRWLAAGSYELTCTFLRGSRPIATVSWDLAVDSRYGSAEGRTVRPTEPGTLVFVKGGAFMMGAPADAPEWTRWADCLPAHEVSIRDFSIGKYPVTALEYSTFLSERGNPDGRYLTVEGEEERKARMERNKGDPGAVTADTVGQDSATGKYQALRDLRYCFAKKVPWLGAVEYCKWLSERTGKRYRLPTEAEWEYVARGTEGRKYPWGSDEPLAGGKAMFSPGRLAEFGLYWAGPIHQNIGSFPAGDTPQGVSDMYDESRREWCSDAYLANYYLVSPRGDPKGPEVAPRDRDSVARVVRGRGASQSINAPLWHEFWVFPAWRRDSSEPSGGEAVGMASFRVVMEAEPSEAVAAPDPR